MSMTFSSSSRTAAFASTTAKLARVVSNRVGHVAKVVVNRWMVKQLCDFTDHELADIGLSRADLRDAFDGPAFADPSLKLAAAAHGNSMKIHTVAVRHAEVMAYAPSVRGRLECRD